MTEAHIPTIYELRSSPDMFTYRVRVTRALFEQASGITTN